jgi:hypothetical protein
MASCSGITGAGGRCKAQAISDTEWCFNHHPGYEEQRRRRGSRGGKRGGRGRPMVDVSNIKQRLEELAEEVLAGNVDRGDAAVAGQLYNYALRAIGVGLRVHEQQEIEARLEELEVLLVEREAG